MTDAGGTSTITKIGDCGQASIWRLRNTDVTHTETMPLDITGSPFVAEDEIIIIGALDDTNEKQVSGSTLDVEYDETNMHFTITQASLSNTQVDIYFMYVGRVGIDID